MKRILAAIVCWLLRMLTRVTIVHPAWHEWLDVTALTGDPDAYARKHRAAQERRDRHA